MKGVSPNVLHFFNNEAQALYLKNGELHGKITNTPNGVWGDREFEGELNITPDIEMINLKLSNLSGFGTVGSYKTGDCHKLLIYELQVDISEYLNAGKIKHTIDSPISIFNLQLENPIKDDDENVAISERAFLISPGARIGFSFSMGDSDEFQIGTFYVDRSDFTLLSETVSVDGRNLIGKAFKDQTFGEKHNYSVELLSEVVRKILVDANISPYKMLIANTSIRAGFTFSPNMDYLSGLLEVFKATLDWKIEENTDGTIIVGNSTFQSFTPIGRFEFFRNKDIFSRKIVRDDMNVYRRVCVHDREFSIAVYKDVEEYIGWNLQSNKTLFVNVPEGTELADATIYANELAIRLAKAGKLESFTGPLRPYIVVGDSAVIIDEYGKEELGLITEITHSFGKDGYYTNFTVDSGGVLGKGRIADYISQVTSDKKETNRTYD